MNGSSQLCRTERCTEPPFCMVVRTEGCLRTELSAVRTDSYTGLCAAVAVRHSVLRGKITSVQRRPFLCILGQNHQTWYDSALGILLVLLVLVAAR